VDYGNINGTGNDKNKITSDGDSVKSNAYEYSDFNDSSKMKWREVNNSSWDWGSGEVITESLGIGKKVKIINNSPTDLELYVGTRWGSDDGQYSSYGYKALTVAPYQLAEFNLMGGYPSLESDSELTTPKFSLINTPIVDGEDYYQYIAPTLNHFEWQPFYWMYQRDGDDRYLIHQR
jgi:hypothetical protein